jgi:cysteine-rich repeat protein
VVCTALDQCHDAGTCNPANGTCANPAKADTTPCDDGSACSSNDVCTNGVCAGVSLTCGNGVLESGCDEQCDDGNTTNGDGCSATCQTEPACPAQPRPQCRGVLAPKGGAVTVKEAVFGRGTNKLTWKWKGGPLTVPADFGTPGVTTAYHFCVYDESADAPTLVMSVTVPPGGTCGTKPCWKVVKNGFQYTDKTLHAQGVKQVKLKGNIVPGKAQLQVKGTGGTLPVPPMPFVQDSAVVMQIANDAGVCWETVFTTPATKNVTTQFKDKTVP